VHRDAVTVTRSKWGTVLTPAECNVISTNQLALFYDLELDTWHVKLCLVEQKYPSQNQKPHVPGFSPKYFTIWGRNMDTTHTTGEQITGN
jgi:hypothetical protein